MENDPTTCGICGKAMPTSDIKAVEPAGRYLRRYPSQYRTRPSISAFFAWPFFTMLSRNPRAPPPGRPARREISNGVRGVSSSASLIFAAAVPIRWPNRFVGSFLRCICATDRV